jgi:hypothetical protein
MKSGANPPQAAKEDAKPEQMPYAGSVQAPNQQQVEEKAQGQQPQQAARQPRQGVGPQTWPQTAPEAREASQGRQGLSDEDVQRIARVVVAAMKQAA